MKRLPGTPLARAAVALLAVAVLACGLLAGCSTSAFSGGWSGAVTPTSDHPETSEVGDSGNSGATVSSPAQPQVTVATTATVAANTLPGYGKPQVLLGDMNTDEQFILGQLYQIALQHEGYNVAITRNIGTTQISQGALKQGSLTLYPEYLNVWDSQVAHVTRPLKSAADAYEAGESFASRKGWAILTPTPFSDTSGIAVSAQFAQLNHIRSLTELAHQPQLTIGAPPEFAQGSDALPALERTYHFKPGYVQSINIGDQYTDLDSGIIQASYVSTTDPQLSGPQYVLLSDPKHVFGFGNVVPVTTEKVISEEGPAFAQTLDRVDALLTQSAMRGLLYEVEIKNDQPPTVATQFLQGNGILPINRYEPVTTNTGS